MIAHVICCNDAIMGVVLVDEEVANRQMEVLAEKHYLAHNQFDCFGKAQTFEQYRQYVYWHLHFVTVLN